MKISDIINQLEFKIALGFGAVVLFLVLFIGIISQVRIGIIIKRMIIAEVLFVPMGFFVGHVLKGVMKESSVSPQKTPSIQEKEKEEDLKAENMKESNIEAAMSSEGEQPTSPMKGDTQSNDASELDTAPSTPSAAAPQNEEKLENLTQREQLQKLKDLSKDALGDHIIVNDRKIINDPEVMAKAVRTMMNRDE